MSTTNYINNTAFDSFFQKRILDNNGISVTDINAGLMNLFAKFNEEEATTFFEVERRLCSELEDGYPDVIALRSSLGNQGYWWWLLLLNRLENPFTDIKTNWIYSINSPLQISNFIDATNNSNNNSITNDRYGSIVELN